MIEISGTTVTATCDRCGLQMVLASGLIGLEVAASPSRQAEVLEMADWTCGADEPDKKEEPMKVEDTAFGPLVGTPKKVEDRVNANQDQYRESLDRRLDQDEGGGPKDEEPSGD